AKKRSRARGIPSRRISIICRVGSAARWRGQPSVVPSGQVAPRLRARSKMALRRGSGLLKKGAMARLRWMPGALPRIKAQFVGVGGVGVGIGDGIDDGAGDAVGEEVEERGVEVGEGSGEGIIDFGGGEVGGAVVGVGGGEHEVLGAQALAAIDGF